MGQTHQSRLGLVRDLAPCDPDHLDSARGEIGVASAIRLEGTTVAMERESVDLDSEGVLTPYRKSIS